MRLLAGNVRLCPDCPLITSLVRAGGKLQFSIGASDSVDLSRPNKKRRGCSRIPHVVSALQFRHDGKNLRPCCSGFVNMSLGQYRITALCPSASLMDAIRTHWREYLMEAAEMAMLMLCICCAGSLLYGRNSAVAHLGFSWLARSAIMGAIVAGGTFIIIHSPFGRRSGAHFNPALTVAYSS